MFNQETTKGHNEIGKSLTMVLRQVHMLKLALQESLEIARHWPEWATLRAHVSLLWMAFNIYKVVRAAYQSQLGTYRSNDETATGTSLNVLSDLGANIPI